MKKNITLRGAALAAFLSVSFMSQAQDQPRKFGKIPMTVSEYGSINCATTENEQILRENNPKRETTEQFESWIAQKIQEEAQNRNPKSGNAIYTIPVVVHIIHNGDAIGQNENISDQRVFDQIRVLNEDFGGMIGTPGEDLLGLGGDTGIRFCLASIDPNGAPTNGIDRYNGLNPVYNSRTEVENIKAQTSWDPTKYFNIWVVNWGGQLGDLLGYAQFPQSSLPGIAGMGGAADTDGVAISYRNFGYDIAGSAPYNKGRTTTHETGHYLGLRHIWGDKNNTCQGEDDYVADTPVAAKENRGCNEDTDSCPQPGLDMVQNYMDYTNDACMYLFTKGQASRMKTVLDNSINRKTLYTSGVCGTASSQEFQYLMGTNVYPNPAQDVLNISVTSENMPDSYTIFNSLGQTITTVNNVTNAALTVNTSAYSNGIYFIKINKGAESKTIKFVKN